VTPLHSFSFLFIFLFRQGRVLQIVLVLVLVLVLASIGSIVHRVENEYDYENEYDRWTRMDPIPLTKEKDKEERER